MANWYLGGALLVNAAPAFDVVVEHYRRFGSEPMAATNTFMGVSMGGSTDATRSAPMRFSNFLELIQALTAVAGQGYAVLVNHGMSDTADNPLGLVLPLTKAESPWRVDEYVLGLLAGFIGNEPSEAELTRLEKTSHIGKANASIPPGTLKSLHQALKLLRDKNLKRLEIRACNLGGNTKVLQLMLKVFGITEALSAPDVHMFYGPMNIALRATTDAGFQRAMSVHRTARVFTDAAQQKPGSFAMQITGKGPVRGSFFVTTTTDVSWFVDQNIMWGHYPSPSPTATMVPPFSYSGMDVSGSFVLPLEDAYRSHIVEVTP